MPDEILNVTETQNEPVAESPEQENPEIVDSDSSQSEQSENATTEQDDKNASGLEDTEENEDSKTLEELPLPNESKEEKYKLPNWAEKRLARKEKEIEQQRAEAEALRSELEKLRSPNSTNEQGKINTLEPIIGAIPDRENYNSDMEFINACFDYRQKSAQAVDMINQNIKKQQVLTQKTTEKHEIGADKYQDFDEKVSNLYQKDFPANPDMYEAIIDSEHAEDLLYFFGSNPKQTREIAQLPPIQAVKKVAEIEMRFKNRKQSNVSKASAPIKPLNTNQSGHEITGSDLDRIAKTGSQKEFEQAYEKFLNKKAKKW